MIRRHGGIDLRAKIYLSIRNPRLAHYPPLVVRLEGARLRGIQNIRPTRFEIGAQLIEARSFGDHEEMARSTEKLIADVGKRACKGANSLCPVERIIERL